MTMIEARLRALGDALDLDDGHVDRQTDALAASVLERLDEVGLPGETEQRDSRRPLLRIAAAVVLVLAVAVAAVPTSRRAVADWFGFEGVSIERRPDVSVPTEPDPLDGGADGEVGEVVDVDGTDVLVSEFTGTLDNPAIGKIASPETNVVRVEVDGEFAVWIDGAPHEVSFAGPNGDIRFERFAGNTLLWQDGATIRRLEGFDDADAAIAYAEQIGDD